MVADPPAALGRTLGALLLAQGLITDAQLSAALEEQKQTQEKLGAILVRRGDLTEDQLVEVLARRSQVPVVAIPDSIPAQILGLLPAAFAAKYETVPIGRTPSSLTLAMVDPTNVTALDEAAFRTGLRIIPVLARPSDIRKAIERYYSVEAIRLAQALGEAQMGEVEVVDEAEEHADVDLQELRASADEAPVVRLLNMVLYDAIRQGASDVHVEPEADTFRIRYRIDGVLREVMTPPRRLMPAVVSRIKIMASLDIAERRLPQDGRIRLRYQRREVNIRVATLPGIRGESVVLRLLDREALTLDLGRLGLDDWSLAELRKAIRRPWGIIIATGPTGSGKTTTLYAIVEALRSPDVKIVTVEDPVEYELPGIHQVQVNEDLGLTFPAALRAFLRQDPNIMLVGEIRDQETAQIAARAALTGHLVLSTLHTNDAPSAIVRLRDMGIPAYLIESSLLLVVAQRLVRKLCPACREPYEVDEAALAHYGLTAGDGRRPVSLYRARGCAACHLSGYTGREGLYEVMPLEPPIRDLIHAGAGTSAIREAAIQVGMRTLRTAGLAKVRAGITSLDEVLRVTVAY